MGLNGTFGSQCLAQGSAKKYQHIGRSSCQWDIQQFWLRLCLRVPLPVSTSSKNIQELEMSVRALREDENFAASRNPFSGLQCSLIFFTHFKTFLKSGFEGPTALVDSCSKMWLLICQSSNLSSLICIKALLLSPLLRFAFCPSGSWLKKPGRSRAPTALAAVGGPLESISWNHNRINRWLWINTYKYHF